MALLAVECLKLAKDIFVFVVVNQRPVSKIFKETWGLICKLGQCCNTIKCIILMKGDNLPCDIRNVLLFSVGSVPTNSFKHFLFVNLFPFYSQSRFLMLTLTFYSNLWLALEQRHPQKYFWGGGSSIFFSDKFWVENECLYKSDNGDLIIIKLEVIARNLVPICHLA